jgi:hypothetical protein
MDTNTIVDTLLDSDSIDKLLQYDPHYIASSINVCTASPNDESMPSQFTKYDTNQLKTIMDDFNNIKITENVDSFDREFFCLDDSGLKPLVLVVFKTQSSTLVSVNDIVLPLSEFMKITHLHQEIKESSENTIKNIRDYKREEKSGFHVTVLCKTSMNTDITIPNTTVKLVMMAMTIFQKKYKL